MREKKISSTAVWFDEFDDDRCDLGKNAEPTLHLDINLWSTQKADDSYLEVGFKISDWVNLQKVHCFIPFDVGGSVFDKSEYLRENQVVLEALLNKSVNLKSFTDDERFIEVQFPDNREKSALMLYTPQKNLEVLHDKNGSNICIKLPKKIRQLAQKSKRLRKSQLYIRLRFKASSLYPLVTSHKPFGRFFKGEFEEISFVDFRINSYRSLPLGLKVKSKNTPISSMNFFLMTDEWNKIEIETNGMSGSRLLESHIWTDYLSDYNTPTGVKKKNGKAQIIAYHWNYPPKKNADGGFIYNKKGYNIFIKLYRSKSTWRSFVATLILVLSAGVVSSYFTSLFFGSGGSQ